MVERGSRSSQWLIEYLEQEDRRLAGMNFERADGIHVLFARRDVAVILSELYKSAGRLKDAGDASLRASGLQAQIIAAGRKWRPR